MKKLLLVVALFVGIPSFASADTLGCVGGALVGGVLGSKIGGGKTVPLVMTVLGASAGCNVGSRVEDGTYGQPTEEVVVVNQPSYPTQYGGGYGVGVVCDTTPKQGMAPPRPGMCNNPYNGGEISYEALQREAARREGYQYAQPPVYNHQRRSSVRRAIYSQEESRGGMWDRPEKQRVAGVAAVKRSPRLTVDNYLQPGAVNPQCQTGNWGVDSNCLSALSNKLAELQERCERGEKNSDCRKNPGVIAGEYRTLAAALRDHQDRMQAGRY